MIFTLNRKIWSKCSRDDTFESKSSGAIHTRRDHSRRKKKASIFFRPVCSCRYAMKQDVQSDSSLDHMRGAAAVAQKGKERWRCFKSQCKQTQKKRIPSDSEREQSGCRVLIIFGI